MRRQIQPYCLLKNEKDVTVLALGWSSLWVIV
ncbi:hypothetical protein GGP53_002618 [Salinibacter ruber]|uniref:Uncharacterized protein n=1 Tax=Salinibacter ruber TaxID=146919 RepID=A0A9X2UFZ7_9BACT|nr:hypothetical protein [Salinibacter ruber]MCS3661650.1 hypothetical protein [Salinibacter ruber]MCS3711446.1 hypothetical protein [Salinibacter ruber]MCS4033484.1 hypothetical protein [Salinibacter ruber]MCS4145651.1 hypothetical protein [Salinibacter ruber]